MIQRFKNLKGQISLLTAIVGASGMVIASVFTSWISANKRVYEAESKIQVVEERESNHYLELSKSLEKVDKKIDILLEKSNKK